MDVVVSTVNDKPIPCFHRYRKHKRLLAPFVKTVHSKRKEVGQGRLHNCGACAARELSGKP